MILYTNTIVDPITMMVKSFYTSLTAITMSRSLGHNNSALWTYLLEIDIINNFLKINYLRNYILTS